MTCPTGKSVEPKEGIVEFLARQTEVLEAETCEWHLNGGIVTPAACEQSQPWGRGYL